MAQASTRTVLEPLRALRFDTSQVELGDVVSPPYDVIGQAERAELAQRSPYSMVQLELPESPSQAAQLLHHWRREGVLQRDEEPSLWWHEQLFTGPDGVDRTRGGFFAAVRLSPYDEGRVRPHERTHENAKNDRLAVLRATQTNLSPIFGLYGDPEGGARAALGGAAEREPDMEVTDPDRTVHRFWRVTDPDAIAAVQDAMAEREILIADGHHRYETALAYQAEQREREGDPEGDRPYDFVLMYLANLEGEGLTIFPTHRVVMSQREVDARFMSAFDVRELAEGTTPSELEERLSEIPPGTAAFALWRGPDRPPVLAQVKDPSAVMLAMPAVPRVIRSIDAAVLEALVLAPLLGLEGEQFLATDQIRYVRGAERATRLVDTGDAGSAFLLRPPTVDQVQAVAAAGRLMPQKSTYFFPKLYSGFLLNPLDD